MRDRACDPFSKSKELQHLDEVFQANGHLVKKTLTDSPKQPHTEDLELTNSRGTLYTPYVRGLSGRLEGICTPLNICNVFATTNTLKQVLMRVKLQIPEEKKKDIVYQVPCKDCDGVYTGESKRKLKVRLTERKHAVVRSDISNSITVHVSKNEHSIDWGNARVVRSVRGYWERRATEAIWPTPPSHLEPHPGPDLEINNNAYFLNFIQPCLIYFIILLIYRLIMMYFSQHNIIHYLMSPLLFYIKPITS